ncbi:MAG TPA: alpha/beta fold hydrolase [Euzebyales bacterium]|nr:alpha/beta fold hydrolase [Euzebyales bacterium]
MRLLGPVDVVAQGAVAPLRSAHTRTLLALLAVRAEQVVTTAMLIDAIWGDDPPRTAAHALHVHASTLRGLLPDGVALIGRRGGYVLHVGPEWLDSDRFEALAARARARRRRVGAPRGRRGPALGGAAAGHRGGSGRRAARTRPSCRDRRGRRGHGPRAAVPRTSLGQLLVCLYRSGRQAEALERYRQVRRLLAEELGVDPSPSLRAVEAGILRQDAALAAPPAPGDLPVTHFARAPGGRLAYQVLGAGPPDLLFIPGFGGNVEIRWEEPNLSRLYRRLALDARLVLFDRLGTGLSDRDRGIPALDEQVDDVLAVMDAAGVRRAALLGVLDGGALALLTAAAHPDRVQAVVTFGSFAAFELGGPATPQVLATLRTHLERGDALEGAAALLAPSRAGDPAFTRWLGRYVRMAAGIGGAAAILDRLEQLDIRATLPRVTVPVLALHRKHDGVFSADNARYIAEHVPDGHFAVLPGRDMVIWAGDVNAIAEHIERFLAEVV